MKTYTYRMIIEPDEDGFHGFVPILKGVHTFGKTIEKTKYNLREAIQCHIEGMAKDNLPLPREEDTIEVIQSFTVNA